MDWGLGTVFLLHKCNVIDGNKFLLDIGQTTKASTKSIICKLTKYNVTPANKLSTESFCWTEY